MPDPIISKCKGAVLSLEVASVSTPVSQLIEVGLPQVQTVDFEAETLDQAGVGMPRELTGYADTDGFSSALFWDPTLASHAAIIAAQTTPAKTVWNITLANAAATEIDFSCAGIKFGGQVARRDGLKANLTGNLDGLPVVTV